MNTQDEKQLVNFLKKYTNKNDKILDVGCGIGANLDLLKSVGYNNTIGVDISQDMVSETSRKGHKVYIIDELEKLELKDFDVILFAHVLEHIAYPDIINVMEGYFNMCKPDAQIIIVMPTLYDAFYNDVDHIKPYYPNGLITVFSKHIGSRQYKSNYNLSLIDIMYRKVILLPYNLRSRFIRTLSNKIIYKVMELTAQALKIVSFGLLSKTIGYTAIFKITKS
jgi:SAM-dependent methyltransferase